MDDADRAQQEEAHALQEALYNRRKTLTACGFCHYCNEAVEARFVFCDQDCAADHERLRASREREGKGG
jgi:hypothetical protein